MRQYKLIPVYVVLVFNSVGHEMLEVCIIMAIKEVKENALS
jgi:hypothetical protein